MNICFYSRYKDFYDPGGMLKPCHYSTHYSNAASVIHFMVRMEPFTSLHIDLQSGQFDHANRQFYSLPATWRSTTSPTGDVKELIPEFFFFPEFLLNVNNIKLGKIPVSLVFRPFDYGKVIYRNSM